MADSTVTDFSKMKVVDLRKELKSRGLSHSGDKSELVARLQTAVSQDEHNEINLDSDEIDSDGVLEDEDEKSQSEIALEESIGNETLNEDFALAESPPKETTNPKPQRILKRKIASSETSKEDNTDNKNAEKESVAKKIVLHRATSITSTRSNTDNSKEEKTNVSAASNKIKISANIDPKTRLEMRAKRFGLPVNVSEKDRKEARKIRFGQNSTSTGNTTTAPDHFEKLKKRAERFGQSVSKMMTDLENREKLEKRKAKFSSSI
ncbi:SAP domain-containing ribonucleoprotein [Eumeta japonica]|uniref:SAP domain-containing ribonucleoprotein n=1 Tax=Eumeta variegata TaxID=151549 RepID=A0A4C1VKF9_EUMVA|nr:SAP domain-containing ribonucleoprotein [Eumeta japonica]